MPNEYPPDGSVKVLTPRDSLKVYVTEQRRDGLTSTQIPVILVLATDDVFRRLANLGTRLEIVRESGQQSGETWAAKYGEAVGRGSSPWAAMLGLAKTLEERA